MKLLKSTQTRIKFKCSRIDDTQTLVGLGFQTYIYSAYLGSTLSMPINSHENIINCF
jgi:hypothetical protein